MIKKLKYKFKNRESNNTFWVCVVFVMDFMLALYNEINKVIIFINNKIKIKKYKCNTSTLGVGMSLVGYLNFIQLLDDKHKLKIPECINSLRIDVGLSFNAPVSSKWLKDNNVMVFGFEPNPENIKKINSSFNSSRFVSFDVAIDSNVPNVPKLKMFYMMDGDPGTSSLYKPNYFKIKKIIQVPTIRLSDFLSLIPWKRFKYIDHLKVDTQGNDLNVLKSAGSYLSKIIYVTSETSTFNQYEYSHTENELDAFMFDNGFSEVWSDNENKTYLNNKFKNGNINNKII